MYIFLAERINVHGRWEIAGTAGHPRINPLDFCVQPREPTYDVFSGPALRDWRAARTACTLGRVNPVCG